MKKPKFHCSIFHKDVSTHCGLTDRPTDRQTDIRQTDRPTDITPYRADIAAKNDLRMANNVQNPFYLLDITT